MSLPKILPAELYREIFEITFYICSRRTLLCLSLCSRQFNVLVTPILYRNFLVDSRTACASKNSYVALRERTAVYVVSLEIKVNISREIGPVPLNLLVNLRHLQVIEVNANHYYSLDSRHLAALLSQLIPTSLRKFSLYHSYISDLMPIWTALSRQTELEELRFRCVQWSDAYSQSPLSPFPFHKLRSLESHPKYIPNTTSSIRNFVLPEYTSGQLIIDTLKECQVHSLLTFSINSRILGQSLFDLLKSHPELKVLGILTLGARAKSDSVGICSSYCHFANISE